MASHGNFDRFVLEFADEGRPEFTVFYTSPPFFNIPGNMVGVAGNAFLTVNMHGATTVDWAASGDELVITYEGPDEFRTGTDNITEAVFVTDFESDMEWLIGLAEKTPFTVTALDDPYRIVVDVGHGSLTADDVATQWVSGNTDIQGQGWLTDARLAGHGDFDRFVLEFSADHVGDVGVLGVPEYSVHYVAGPFESCDPPDDVPVAGNLFVLVEVRASAIDWSFDPPLELYDAPSRHVSDTGNVREAVLANDCLGLQWVLGLDHEAPLTVSVLDDPPRLVVDIAH